MSVLLIFIHVIVCVALIMIVLLQTGKGADMGAAFGGGSSQTLFGSTGASTFLSKATTVAAIVFMITSLALAYMSSNRTGKSIMPNSPTPVSSPAMPSETKTDAAPNTPQTAAPSQPQSESAPKK
ncbi:MAG: preprotein translocase subunit SecG [Deltaproteobacteria bacterium]|nr:preprotein translocase subunit SecG [Deltaproteobacteria bacterium]